MQEQMSSVVKRETRDARHERRDPFRAEADDFGRWFVWRRLEPSGWAAWRACRTRSDAIELAASLNHRADPAVPN